MSVPDYSLLLYCSHSNESTIFCVVWWAGCGNRLCLFLIIPFSSSIHMVASPQPSPPLFTLLRVHNLLLYCSHCCESTTFSSTVHIAASPQPSPPLFTLLRVHNLLLHCSHIIESTTLCVMLKVGSWSFEGFIILLIYFLNCRKALFTEK